MPTYTICQVPLYNVYTFYTGTGPLPEFENGYLLKRGGRGVGGAGGGGGLKIIKCPTLTMIGHHVQGPSVNTALIVQSQRGVYFQKNWVGMCSTLPETLTLFQTKICDFPYPISDLTLKSVP